MNVRRRVRPAQGAALLAAGAAADEFQAVPGDLEAVGLDDAADCLRERVLQAW
jgi:hypothetical protein